MANRELNFMGTTPLLYLIATPIGNLDEWSPRALKTIESLDAIACEDTRNSGLLLHRFGLSKTLIPCHEHNEEEASEKIISLMKEGKKIGYMSDAGYPSLSDPGERLARRCLNAGFKISVINGPSAAICALVGSGLPMDHFYFYGFLPSKTSLRDKELRSLKDFPSTLVFYEAPHRIHKTLIAMKEILGGERRACLARELTKLHEEYLRMSLEELCAVEEESLKGEIVLIVEGQKEEKREISDETLVNALLEKRKTLGKDAVKEVAQTFGVNKKRVYKIYSELD